MTHEQSIIDRVTQARQAAITAGDNVEQRAEAENQLTAGLRQLFAVAEAYPQLRASENMVALQEELSSTENRIAFSRQFYSDAVTTYNTARETLPAALFAGMLGFKPATLFAIEDVAEKAVPQVQFP
jgi:LemA protein